MAQEAKVGFQPTPNRRKLVILALQNSRNILPVRHLRRGSESAGIGAISGGIFADFTGYSSKFVHYFSLWFHPGLLTILLAIDRRGGFLRCRTSIRGFVWLRRMELRTRPRRMKTNPRRFCPYCKRWFVPNPRCRDRQKACSDPACKKARKADAQKRWLAKPENKDWWRGSENVQRVREWREKTPQYWKRSAAKMKGTLQDDCPAQAAMPEHDKATPPGPLQDDWLPEDPLLVGIISNLARSTLQDDIVAMCRLLVRVGNESLRIYKTRSMEIVAPKDKSD